MWRVIGLGLLAIVGAAAALGVYLSDKIYLRDNHAEVSAGMLEQAFTPAEIEADIEYMIAKFRETHVNFDAIIDAETLQRMRSEMSNALDAPKTRIEAYRLISRHNHRLQDGHTMISRPAEEWRGYRNHGGMVIPFSVRFSGAGLIVDQALADDLPLENGAHIESINGVAAADLAAWSAEAQSGEGEALRLAYAERSFPADLWAYGIRAPFILDVTGDAGSRRIEHGGIGYADHRARARTSADAYSYRALDATTGLLSFNRMSGPLSGFKAFLKNTFREIKAGGVQTLILDLRDNGGGDSRLGDALHAYLSDLDYPAVKRVDVKVTEDIKKFYRTLLPPGFRWIPLHRFVPVLHLIEQTPPGQSFEFYPDAASPQPWPRPKADQFGGKLIVLTSQRTYSSAVIFAAPLKHFGRAVFVGEETGEPLIFFGENYTFDLPNTKLQAQVSHKAFTLVGAGDERTGIIPDIAAPAQHALSAAMALAEGKDTSSRTVSDTQLFPAQNSDGAVDAAGAESRK